MGRASPTSTTVDGHIVCNDDTCTWIPATAGPVKAFRPAGSPAGTWPHTPWWHCVFLDPYERVNFWSHFIPGLALLALCGHGMGHHAPSLSVYTLCAAITHSFSALTHVYPDSHALEKLDHLGIVATIVGTPVSALMALHGGHLPNSVISCSCGLFACAFLRPTPRTAGFVALALALLVICREVVNANILLQGGLYLTGAVLFLRNGGHSRWTGLTDHHGLHYCVTLATALHVYYLWQVEVN